MLRYLLTMFAIATLTTPAVGAEVGEPAPDFTATDSRGQTVSLANYRNRIVVLEWTRPDCPFVAKHYDSGNMQRQQQDAEEEGIVWLTVNSNASGKDGHLEARRANARLRADNANPTAYLIDSDGTLGHAYGARFAPEMFVIGKDGKVAYHGAIDDVASADPADIGKAEQALPAVLTQLRDGRRVRRASSKPYGCAIRY